ENSLHWVLDVSMKEDSCQIYQHHGAENWAMLRQISLNMLRAEPSKGSIPAKQKRAWMKPEYLESVLLAGLQLGEF
ncbi:transposase, partial [Shewanella sp. SM78]|nr:ISAs1 family transposase [Shewanella sp. SM95]MCU8000852.1 ISAs1 family transposase [Shewanella sp. SM95]MCU8000939.1 ISAs1 family transposase [Shewanella sp. SM95]MCU8024570.1 ISAs1 family transposase [Shewanella sp. SM78]MCU8081515.1 ISAs1 family transposase [Shewanella sp. SM103]